MYIGLLANPASGKDVRRLVARASVFDNQEKQAIVRRAVTGAVAAGGRRFAYLDDRHGIVKSALNELDFDIEAVPVDATQTSTALDTISAARAMKDIGCAVVMTLGGDGTNRAFTLGWQDATLVPISTGTNNVFPNMGEATVCGTAAGLIATGVIKAKNVARQCKLISVTVDGERNDLALIDAVLSEERFVGSRALLSPEQLRKILLTRADPAAVGMTSIGGMIHPLADDKDRALHLRLGQRAQDQKPPIRINAPIAPGYFQCITVRKHSFVKLGKTLTWRGPGVLAFDGERERVLQPDQKAQLTVRRDGPRVVDVIKTLTLAAEKKWFHN